MAVSKRTRYEVLRRDNHTCRYCHATDSPLTVDHVIPTALGGSDDPGNLVAACRDCNAGKASSNPDSPLVEDVSAKALEWGRAIERFNSLQLADRRKRNAFTNRMEKKWLEWNWGKTSPNGPHELPRPSDWKQTAWQFYATGVPIAEVEDAIDIAAGNKKVDTDDVWRYMCGVTWRKVEKMQEGAAALLEADVNGA